jgi:hypothetical protein
MVPIRKSGKGSPMTKPKILITKAQRAEFARDAADEKYRVKLTKAIRELADANAAFNTFMELDVDLGPIKGTKAIPITFAYSDRGAQMRHPQDAAYDIIDETLRINLMVALNYVAYLDEEEAPYRMSSRVWAYNDSVKHPDRFTGTSPKK